ncbi:hypothetical protein [Nocardia sp. NPDC051981]|uniref:hypothetical protein n=1 Tax=Nocardia sp. NPDC051981 TaxID=3155417 RepID=UPI00341D60B9
MSALHSIRGTGRLAPGVHTVDSDGILQRYHVYRSGPVCIAHPAGPGIFWEYPRMPALEEHLTMVYVEALGTGASGRLPTRPHGYTRERYSLALQRLARDGRRRTPRASAGTQRAPGASGRTQRFDHAVREFVFSPKE